MDFKKFWVLLGILTIGTLGLDFIWHFFLTIDTYQGATSMGYFAIKFIIVLLLTLILFFRKKITFKNVLLFPVIFTLALSIYYRFYELFGNIGFGKIAGDISLGSVLITRDSTFLFPLVWFIAHYLVLFIPLLIAWGVYKIRDGF